MARILFTSVGSWGDLFPLIGTGRELQARGHKVKLAASPAWRNLVSDAGLSFVPVGRHIGFEEFAAHPEIFGRMPLGLRAALGRFVFDQIDDITRDLRTPIAETDLVVSHPAQVVAFNLAEKLETKAAAATVFPSMLRSAYTVPGGSSLGPWSGPIGRLLNRLSWSMAGLGSSVLFDRPINAHRRQLGLRPVRSALLKLPQRTEGVVVLADPAIVDPPPDWPDHVQVTSFVTWDTAGKGPLPPRVVEFLQGGDPPVLITLGASSAVAAGDFFERAARDVLQLGARALVITGPANPPRDLDSDRALVADFLPFSALLPSCRAAIHHAGIGTTVSVLRAGIPQLAVPMGFDQPDTAQLIERLGVGIQVAWKHRKTRLSMAIERLLNDAVMADTAVALRAVLEQRNGADLAATAIEHILTASEQSEP